ncbi:MAG TPA: helix-turn-helix transcriptional regulator [Longimicrobium sp.]|nr:helix-turn-helix transcriptional regulator [Longimicrobium sp.]
MLNSMPREEHAVRDLGDLAEVVKRRRLEERLSLREAADRFGVGRRLLVELEAGKRNVRASTLLDLMQLLGYDVVLRRRRPGAP